MHMQNSIYVFLVTPGLFQQNQKSRMRLWIVVTGGLLASLLGPEPSLADLEWNSLTDYLKTFKVEEMEEPVVDVEPEQPGNPMLR